ncbi:lupus la protein [Lasallia pustulata]|uniref:Lupus la protein n=1 Tax=Lasallia pustulata TaxID=136370 RepID=A0A1W5D6A2_9LECA|nr:lupus la protein [Lasallia pustulata]
MPRSVYVKGFGEEVPSTQFDIEAFFAPYGPTNAIRLRRNNEKLFKGSVFVEFETDDLQKAFLELETKPKWDGKELQIMSKKQYCDQKVEDIKAGKIKSNNSYDQEEAG